MSPTYEVTIGLEVHCQLATHTKMFCSCPIPMSLSQEEVNAFTCPICLGHPGTLPLINKQAVLYAVQAGLATHCQIQSISRFDRKHYFYPDLPKGYQITQQFEPICTQGWIPVGKKKICIQRIHLEEDAGKNTHLAHSSFINFNRAGIPLIEIVSAPELSNPQEASSYLKTLYQLIMGLKICHGNMQDGHFRCDVNVSLSPIDSEKKKKGIRAEIKNLNSFRFVEKAIEYEIMRQTKLLKEGKTIIQETRFYDPGQDETFSLRKKENTLDYQYFPDPDIFPLHISPEWLEEIRLGLPESPWNKKERLIKEYDLSDSDVNLLIDNPSFLSFFKNALLKLPKNTSEKFYAKYLMNWLAGEISYLINQKNQNLETSLLTPDHLVQVIWSIEKGQLSHHLGKQIIQTIWDTGDSVENIMKKEGLGLLSETDLEHSIQKILKNNPGPVKQFQEGKEKLLGFFIGLVMKETQGKAPPELLTQKLKQALLAHPKD